MQLGPPPTVAGVPGGAWGRPPRRPMRRSSINRLIFVSVILRRLMDLQTLRWFARRGTGPGRHAGAVGWHGTQRGVITLGHAKLRVQRPRLRNAAGEVAVPGYAALAADGALSQRIADILVCNVSTRKYARVVHRCAAAVSYTHLTLPTNR